MCFVCFGVALPFFTLILVFWFFFPENNKFGCLPFFTENNKIVFWRGFAFWLSFHQKKQNLGVLAWLCLFLPKTAKFGSFGVVLPFFALI